MARPKKLGRPSSYRKEWPELIKTYVNECQEIDKLPFIKEICYKLSINVRKIEFYSQGNNKFREAVDYLKYVQEQMLVQNGIKRKYDPSMARFILAANHGYVETSKQINEGNQPVTVQLDMSGGYLPPQSLTQPHKAIPTKATKPS